MHSDDDVRGVEGQVQPDHRTPDPDVANCPTSSGTLIAEPQSWLRNRSPIATARSSRPSASMVSMAASAGRQAIGLPPKVEACMPGLSTAATAGRAIITPAAIPPARALAQVRMSGSTAHRADRRTSARFGPCRSEPRRGSTALRARRTTAAVREGNRAGDIDAPLALDRLDQDRGGLIVEDRGDRREVVVGHVDEARHHRLEAHVVLGLGRRRQRGEGPAVEAPFHRDDLEAPLLVTIGPCQLDRCLVGFGSAVAEEALAAESISTERPL